MGPREDEFNLYKDIQARTRGEIYLGIVGPVRTGKSTFIKRFMNLFVIPQMEDTNEQMRAQDELPQSAAGRTIMTTEPKFIPKEAARIEILPGTECRVRLIDCVGYMVEGAAGHQEDGEERMVKTPWSDVEIPFTKAAEIGTDKVIRDHSTIGIVVTTDGSIGEIERDAYIGPEERTVKELWKLKKPFLILLNTVKPYAEDTLKLAGELEEKYGVSVIPVNCEQLKREDVNYILEQALMEFPIRKLNFYMPAWVKMLPAEHPLRKEILATVRAYTEPLHSLKQLQNEIQENGSIKEIRVDHIDPATGIGKIQICLDEEIYYELLSDMTGEEIKSEYDLANILKKLSEMKKEYEKVRNAMEMVRQKGYGVVMPERDEITLEDPELIRHGNKFGVKIKADSPSVHLIRANIETEIAPIVGTQEQAEDLISYIVKDEKEGRGIWNTNIFGKTVEQLVYDGISGKISMIGDESQLKLQDTMQKIVNDTNGGLICIIL